jgi:hypothetical protein
MNAELEYAGKTYGFQNPEYDTMDVSYLQKQLNIVNNEISDIQKKIQNKQAEIEAIKAGTNLSDLDIAAREEYVRTGSSAPMQSLENSRLSREMTAKTQADIDEQTLNETIKQISNVEADLFLKYNNGAALTPAERSEFLKSYAEYERLAKQLKKLNGTQYNDSGATKDTIANNGIDDTFEEMKKTVGGTDKVITDKTTSGTKILPVDLKKVDEFASQYKNYDVDELKKAKETIVTRLGDDANGNDLDLDNSNVERNKAALEDAGFNVYSFSNAKQSFKNKAAEKLIQGAIDAAFGGWRSGRKYSNNNFKTLESGMKVALSKYNTDKNSSITWESIKEAVKTKIKTDIGELNDR